jgi:multisubunit Na+/H+ antiporter MnhB subunit
MENQIAESSTQPEVKPEPSVAAFNTAVILYGASLILVAIGFYVMYHYGDYNEDVGFGDKAGHVVGGDAYNYIIIGLRGLGYMISGLLSAVVGSAFLIVDRLNKK